MSEDNWDTWMDWACNALVVFLISAVLVVIFYFVKWNQSREIFSYEYESITEAVQTRCNDPYVRVALKEMMKDGKITRPEKYIFREKCNQIIYSLSVMKLQEEVKKDSTPITTSR